MNMFIKLAQSRSFFHHRRETHLEFPPPGFRLRVRPPRPPPDPNSKQVEDSSFGKKGGKKGKKGKKGRGDTSSDEEAPAL